MSNTAEIFSDEVEKAVLSTLWYYAELKNEAVIKLIPQLTDKLFWEPAHREIFKAMKLLWPNSITLVAISFKVNKKVPPYKVTEILNVSVASITQLEGYIGYLKSLTFRRYAHTSGEAIKIAASQDDTNAIMSEARKIGKIYQALAKRQQQDFFSRAVEGEGNDLIPTVFPKLNALIGGFSRREISSIGGKAGHLKTAWCIDNATESIKAGIVEKIHYVSVEHPGDIIAVRILSKEFNIPYQDIIQKKAVFNKDECYKFLKTTYGQRFLITDSAFTIRQVIDSIRANPADQHIIDHAQELVYYNNNMVDGISELLLELKQPAREQNASVVLVSQVVDKQVNERVDSKIPRSADFYNSSRIKQESRQQLVIYWKFLDEFEFDADNPEQHFNKALIVVYKSTYGRVGRVYLDIKPEIGRFK